MLWGVDLDEGLIKVDTDMRTSKKGVFACGDVVAYKGKYKEIVVACGEAAIASNSVTSSSRSPTGPRNLEEFVEQGSSRTFNRMNDTNAGRSKQEVLSVRPDGSRSVPAQS